MVVSTALAWFLLHRNIAMIVWMGIGGMMATLTGPLLLGMFWRRATAAGAMAGFVVGAVVFSVLKVGVLPTMIADGDAWSIAVIWLGAQAVNPFSCATIGQAASMLATAVVSLATTPLGEEHLRRVFGE